MGKSQSLVNPFSKWNTKPVELGKIFNRNMFNSLHVHRNIQTHVVKQKNAENLTIMFCVVYHDVSIDNIKV